MGILFLAQICVADSAKRKEKQFVVFIVAAHLKTGYHRLVKTMCTFVCLFVFVSISYLLFSTGCSMAEHVGRINQSAPCNSQVLFGRPTELTEG